MSAPSLSPAVPAQSCGQLPTLTAVRPAQCPREAWRGTPCGVEWRGRRAGLTPPSPHTATPPGRPAFLRVLAGTLSDSPRGKSSPQGRPLSGGGFQGLGPPPSCLRMQGAPTMNPAAPLTCSQISAFICPSLSSTKDEPSSDLVGRDQAALTGLPAEPCREPLSVSMPPRV